MSKAAVASDRGSLPWLVRRAANALAGATTAAEVLDARDKATAAYDEAKRAARLASAKSAHDDIIAAAYKAQGDALEIESLAKSRLADEFDAAQACGEVAQRGRRSDLGRDGQVPTTAEIGLNGKAVYEARRIRDVIKRSPSALRQAIDVRIARGDEPSRAYLRREVFNLGALAGSRREEQRRASSLYWVNGKPVEAMSWADLSRAIARGKRELAVLERIAGHVANATPDTKVRDAISNSALAEIISKAGRMP